MRTEVRKQKTEGRQRLGFWLVAGLALMMGMAATSYGRSHGSVAAGLGATITLRVFNYAGASAGVIAQAEKEADYILGQAGVKMVWWDCLAKNAEPGCSGVFGPNDLTLRILPGEPKGLAALPEDTFGFALLPSAATVYASRVEILASSIDADQEYPTLLGDVMAHEVGHLLLGSSSHSQTGIMQAQWQTQTLRQGIKRLLHFTPEQASELRIRAHERWGGLRTEARANTSRH